MIRGLWLASAGVPLSLTCSATAGSTAVETIARGKALLEEVCVVCHDDERIRKKNADLAGWRATVERMAAKKPGHLTETEIGQISDYLTVVRPLPSFALLGTGFADRQRDILLDLAAGREGPRLH